MAVLTKETLVARFTQLIRLIATKINGIPVNQTDVQEPTAISDLTIATPQTSGSLGVGFNEKTKTMADANFTEEKSGVIFNYANDTFQVITYSGTQANALNIPVSTGVDTEDFTETELTTMWNTAFGA